MRHLGIWGVTDEVCRPDGDDDYEEYGQEDYTCVVRKLMLSLSVVKRLSAIVFRTRCTVQGCLCDHIIDSGSQKNIKSKGTVESYS